MRSKVRLSSLRGPRSDLNGTGARLLCAMSATEDPSSPLHSVTDHAATAVLAGRSERVDRALEAVIGTAQRGMGDPSWLSGALARWLGLLVWWRGADVGQRGAAIALHGNISQRDDADDLTVLVHDRKTTDGFVAHEAHRLSDTGRRRYDG